MGKDLQNTDMFSGHLARGRFDIVINIALSDSRFHKLKNSNYLKLGVFPAPWVARNCHLVAPTKNRELGGKVTAKNGISFLFYLNARKKHKATEENTHKKTVLCYKHVEIKMQVIHSCN